MMNFLVNIFLNIMIGLNFISNFSGSYGFALILKNKNYLFVDGRYTLQAKNESGKFLKLLQFQIKCPCDILKKKI